ncbi:MAG: double-strand break repair helicase AddA [Alphaproteobacteria bacterium]|nr:double-strand break repair helicase AddA [Alphaproteobacteria bacterium]
MSLHKSPDHLQRLAADPQACVWVAASAGTGKTKVLTDRVLNLLLQGAEPQRILCLTFTRAAAGEMQNRLHQRLSEWVTLSPTDLKEKLTVFLGDVPSSEQILRARTLFPLVLDSPGGMKIQTIHGFCQSILKRFPLEASLTPHFQVLDENLSDHLLQNVQNDLLRTEDSFRPYLFNLTDVFDDASFSEMLGHLMGDRHKWSWVLQESPHHLRQEVEKILQVSLDDCPEALVQEAFRPMNYDRLGLLRAADGLMEGSDTDQQRGRALKSCLDVPDIKAYMALFLTASGEVRKRLATKKVSDKYPEITELLNTEGERMQALMNRLHSLECAKRTWSILQLGVAILRRYSQEKQRRGVLDYNDLIEKTAHLLRIPDVAPWVLYKLDGGLDHILVDEAQDTNLHQWTVISALAEEFFSGFGARENQRTLFVVGDAKQSIYSFQGANPYVFEGMRRHFTQAIQAAKANWREVQLNISFRSTQAVLALVDQVFAHLVARDGVAIQDEHIEHHSFRKGHGGIVELWPLVRSDDPQEIESWSPPTTIEMQDVAPSVRLAETMALQIKQWLEKGELLPSKGRPLRAGDIMVLVRRRSSFVEDLVRALKKAGVPVAGADRMDLLAHLAVQDLIALGKSLIQPLDDLNLACVLKGPFFHMTEEALFDLAYNRGEKSLWVMLQEKNPSMADRLSDFMALAQQLTPFDFYASLLGPHGGRKALLSRLGYESLDPIEEFLNVVQQYQMNQVPSLLGFLQWLAEGDLEVKRDLEHGEQDEVRIMTVHGSKGLQAPIVFLPDTVQTPRYSERILWAHCRQDQRLPVWSPPSQKGCAVTDQLKQVAQNQIDQEYRRLLYVALTRAEDRLYVCGWQTSQEPTEGSWYNLVAESIADLGHEIDYDFTELSSLGWKGKGYRHSCPQLVTTHAHVDLLQEEGIPLAPSWLQQMPMPEGMSEGSLRPSSPAPFKIEESYDRGSILHKLLQYLPDVPESQRLQAGRQLLKSKQNIPQADYDDLVTCVLRVLRHPEFMDIFGQNSRAEVPLTAKLNGRVVSGQVDRLVVRLDEVIIVDYKTHRIPPTDIHEVPSVYLQQLSTYKEILQRIYPHHTIRCVLLWTQTLDLMEIPQYMLNN